MKSGEPARCDTQTETETETETDLSGCGTIIYRAHTKGERKGSERGGGGGGGSNTHARARASGLASSAYHASKNGEYAIAHLTSQKVGTPVPPPPLQASTRSASQHASFTGATCKKTRLVLSAFAMFVPSLSWQKDHF
jgi:hypothetical protein